MPKRIATADELNQAQIDIEYLAQIFGSRAEVARQIGVSVSVLHRLNSGDESITAGIATRIREATKRIEQTSSAGTTEQPKKATSNGGVIGYAREAHKQLNLAVGNLLSASGQAPAISALGFEYLAKQVEQLRVKYLDPIV
jgi:pyruvate/2-oxoglutarate dehydrogenase complex dihydrolipoamide dehydrogenase (E3) component